MMSVFEKAKFILTPNGYKAGKLYALKPENGDLDVTWVRNGNATRVNQNGLIESVGNNVPRLDYLNGSCPSILVEEQETNVRPFSDDFTDYQLELVTIEETLLPSPILGKNAWLINFEPDIISQFRFRDPNNAGIYTDIGDLVSFYARVDGMPLQMAITWGPGGTQKNITITNEWKRFSNIKTIDSGTNPQLRNINAFPVEVYIQGVNYVKGKTSESQLSSYIPTESTAVTRPSDAPQPITVPSGTTEIVEALEDGTFNTITTIPTTYTIPFGRFKYILFNGN